MSTLAAPPTSRPATPTPSAVAIAGRLIDHASDMLSVIDIEGVRHYVNPACERILGYRPDELIGHNAAEIDHPDDAAAIVAFFDDLAARPGATGRRETRVLHRDGSTRWLELSIANCLDDPEIGAFVVASRDITERKLAETELAHERELLRTLIDHLPDVVYVKDGAGRFTQVNPAAAELYGLTDPVEAIGKTDFDVFALHEAAEFRAIEERLMATGQPNLNQPERVERAGQPPRWLLSSKVPVRDAAGRVVGLLGTTRDITALKATEQALAASQERFTKAFQVSPIGIVITDVGEGRFVEVNDAYLGLFGYTRDDLLGRTAFDLRLSQKGPKERAAFVAELRKVGAMRDLEGEAWTSSGERRLVSVSAELIELDGEPCVLSLVSDVTERRAAETALRASEARFRALVQHATDIVQIVGPDGSFRYESPAIERVIGYRPYELPDDRSALIHPDDFGMVVERWEHARREPGPHRLGQFRILHRDGTYRWIDQTVTNLLDDPAIGGFVFNWRDVTQEHEADRMKTEFVSLVSHELRTPLTSIKGYVELLLGDEVGPLSPEQVEFLQIVGTNADRLISLINDLLDISRIEAGKIGLHRVARSPLAAIQEAIVSLRPQLDSKRQRVELTAPPDLPVVWADSDRLVQILTNLISNAGKYTPAGGQIRVSAEAIDDAVRFAVTDTGAGLTSAEQALLFEKFYRANNQATRAVPGTGLGLTIVRSLVELHGGRISVKSEPGMGSTFAFTIPLEPFESTTVR